MTGVAKTAPLLVSFLPVQLSVVVSWTGLRDSGSSPVFLVNGSLLMAPLFPRSGPGESGSPTSAVILRCYDFPTRIPGHLFVSLPGSTLSFSVRVSRLALALPEGRRGPSGPGQLFNRRPQVSACSRVGVSGISQCPSGEFLNQVNQL